MKATDQRSQHMTVIRVIVIARPIQIGGHQADRIKTVLLTQGFAELDTGNLGDCVALVSGL